MNPNFHNPRSYITLEKRVKFWVTPLSSPQAHINWVPGFDPKDLSVRNIPLPNLHVKIASLPSVLRAGIYAFLITSIPLRLLRDSFLPSRVTQWSVPRVKVFLKMLTSVKRVERVPANIWVHSSSLCLAWWTASGIRWTDGMFWTIPRGWVRFRKPWSYKCSFSEVYPRCRYFSVSLQV